MGADRLLERRARLVVLPLARVDHRQVVVRLGKIRIVLRELGEDVDRFLLLSLLGKDQALEKPRLRILRIRGERAVHALERLRRLAGLEQLLCVFDIAGARGRDPEKGERAKQDHTATQQIARGV